MLSSLCVLVLASGTAHAQCVEPAVPPALDGTTATEDQLRTAMANARDFVAQSNIYQDCLAAEIEAAKAQPPNPSPDPAVQDMESRIAANQKLKEKVSLDASNTMDAYKKSHAN